ncbi:MAG: hypothetical protein QOI15_849 [Pseudonocardiales bacterium]|nr:hypothetical protein [Pseudonocardiales bacterium]
MVAYYLSPSPESQSPGQKSSNVSARGPMTVTSQSRRRRLAAHSAAAAEWGAHRAGSYDYLAEIVQPALVVNGSDDIVIPTANSYLLQ